MFPVLRQWWLVLLFNKVKCQNNCSGEGFISAFLFHFTFPVDLKFKLHCITLCTFGQTLGVDFQKLLTIGNCNFKQMPEGFFPPPPWLKLQFWPKKSSPKAWCCQYNLVFGKICRTHHHKNTIHMVEHGAGSLILWGDTPSPETGALVKMEEKEGKKNLEVYARKVMMNFLFQHDNKPNHSSKVVAKQHRAQPSEGIGLSITKPWPQSNGEFQGGVSASQEADKADSLTTVQSGGMGQNSNNLLWAACERLTELNNLKVMLPNRVHKLLTHCECDERNKPELNHFVYYYSDNSL